MLRNLSAARISTTSLNYLKARAFTRPYQRHHRRAFCSFSSSSDGDTDGSSSRDLITQTGDNAPKLDNIICVPLTKRPIFPHFTANIVVKDDNVANALIATLAHNGNGGYIGLFYRKPVQGTETQQATAQAESTADVNTDIVTHADQIHHVGTFAQITSYTKREFPPIGKTPLAPHHEFIVISHRRITINEFLSFSAAGTPGTHSTGVTRATVHHWPKPKEADKETQLAKAYVNEIIHMMR
jgi:ATP-dependent Lon protease